MKSLIIWQKCHKAKDGIIKVSCHRKRNIPLVKEGKINLLEKSGVLSPSQVKALEVQEM